ncbi:MAG: alpha/beta fold hydrolase [Betaproteobacteria bacterium]|nr:alpha/beta fold hydrolase [Betaproteobacteria bacterium]
METTVYYATNRAHEGPERFRPLRYGKAFSSDGMENLRFGRVTFQVDGARVADFLANDRPHTGPGDGEGLQGYFADCVRNSQKIEAYEERINDRQVNETAQRSTKLGSLAMFADLQKDMQEGRDMLLLVHGFNVSWEEAVATASAFEAMINAPRAGGGMAPVRVLLFTWPSDGMALPWVSYKSDRSDARGTAGALGRGLLKMRDYLHEVGRQVRMDNAALRRLRTRMAGAPDAEVQRAVAEMEVTQLCSQKIHLLAHSMGNYVVQNALSRIWDFSPGEQLPRLFDRIFLCSADVDDDVLEPGKPMERLHHLAQSVAIYHNANDNALRVSDYTKGNPDRLGQRGAARPQALHQKIYQVDCAPMVSGLTQHSYYTNGAVACDIRRAIAEQNPTQRGLRPTGLAPNTWQMVPGS